MELFKFRKYRKSFLDWAHLKARMAASDALRKDNVHIDALDNNEDGNDKRDEDAMEKKKKINSKTRGSYAALLLLPEVDVRLGGQSTWDVDG
ncbi:hypothetical protein CTI12_AA513570 [Artemisia annua]|uniref:Uncharacterized protein n=1 Tax=Artemisia annua TaxID=35608 RepID=A0A2U1LAD3_ARTAN|nr:hypothetical protein CTI12_AA513570 [Artemisia annua]